MKSEHNPAQIILYYTPPAPPFFLLQDVREWTWTLNQSPGHTMFQYQTFHMTLLTLSFYALLHPDSIKNGLTALFQDWGGGVRGGGVLLLSSVLNVVTNGWPWRTFAGITQSLRPRGGGGCLRMRVGSRYLRIYRRLFPEKTSSQSLYFCQKKKKMG